jgi:hypothetical protein
VINITKNDVAPRKTRAITERNTGFKIIAKAVIVVISVAIIANSKLTPKLCKQVLKHAFVKANPINIIKINNKIIAKAKAIHTAVVINGISPKANNTATAIPKTIPIISAKQLHT